MKWQIEEINNLMSEIINGKEYVCRQDVIDLLDRKCADCIYFKEAKDLNYKGREIKKTICTNATNVYRQTERHTYPSDRGCKRFERKK